MKENHDHSLGSLDRIRLENSVDRYKEIFRELGETRSQNAVRYINEEKLQFPSLFLLIPEINELNLYEGLNPRNAAALSICAKTSKNQDLAVRLEQRSSESSRMLYPAAEWIFRTGVAEDGLNDPYDQVLDGAASLVIGRYRDQTILPAVADLIFQRNRKGFLIHDLTWSFFQSRSLDTVRLIRGYLRSSDSRDVQLARRLLHFVPSREYRGESAPKEPYEAYRMWLKENSPFLYFTGESFQLTSEPEPYRVDLDAKYLCKRISLATGKPVNPFTEFEQGCLQQFHLASEEEKRLLSDYSYRIHQKNTGLWNQWMRYDLITQIQMAEEDLGGFQ